MNKKADMSINVVIVAALALIVLVVLVFVLSSKIKLFGGSVSACQGKCLPGTASTGYNACETENAKDPNSNTKYSYNAGQKCSDDKNYVCCNAVQVG